MSEKKLIIEKQNSFSVTKVQETYSFKKDYVDKNGMIKKVEVILHIHYINNNYRICNHMGQNHFEFVDNAKHSDMQLAVSELITEAIKFAIKQLNLK